MWFIKKQHEEPKPTLTLKEELIHAKALLAKYELLPDDDFTIHPSPTNPVLHHGVDRKPKVIARTKAKIAELEVLIKEGK